MSPSASFVSCIKSTSGSARSSHQPTFSKRAFSELTFQVAMRIGRLARYLASRITVPSPLVQYKAVSSAASSLGQGTVGASNAGGLVPGDLLARNSALGAQPAGAPA